MYLCVWASFLCFWLFFPSTGNTFWKIIVFVLGHNNCMVIRNVKGLLKTVGKGFLEQQRNWSWELKYLRSNLCSVLSCNCQKDKYHTISIYRLQITWGTQSHPLPYSILESSHLDCISPYSVSPSWRVWRNPAEKSEQEWSRKYDTQGRLECHKII